MDRRELRKITRPENFLAHVKASKSKGRARTHHGGAVETVRESEYRGHRIVVRTTYAIEVDGRPVTGHLGVSNDGRVHYHPVPNASFASAVELVEQLIDAFPDEFEQAGEDHHDGNDGHARGDGHGHGKGH